MFKLEEMPVEVLEEVFNKWNDTKTPKDIYWNTCAICHYIEDQIGVHPVGTPQCEERCPLYETGDCRNRLILSKLHIRYWNQRHLADGENTFMSWYNHRLDFLNRLLKVINNLKNKEVLTPYDKGVIYVKCSKCGSKFNEECLGHLTIKVDDKDRDVLTFWCSNCNNYAESFRYSLE